MRGFLKLPRISFFLQIEGKATASSLKKLLCHFLVKWAKFSTFAMLKANIN